MRAIIVTGDRAALKAWERGVYRALDIRAPGHDLGRLVVLHSGDPGIASMAGRMALDDPYRMIELAMPALELSEDGSYMAHHAAMVTIASELIGRGAELDLVAFHSAIDRSSRSRDLLNRAIEAGIECYLKAAPAGREQRIRTPIESIYEKRARLSGQMRLELDAPALSDQIRGRIAALGMVAA